MTYMKPFLMIILMLMLSVVSACRGQVFSEKNFFAPRPAGMGSPPKDAPQMYLDGWNDGCDTGLSTMNQGIYKSFYKYKRDYTKENNLMYYKAWKDAYTYCRQYAFRYSWQALDHIPQPRKNLCLICPDNVR